MAFLTSPLSPSTACAARNERSPQLLSFTFVPSLSWQTLVFLCEIVDKKVTGFVPDFGP